MKYKVFKRVTRKYEEKFSKEKKTDEIHINVNGAKISIAEHQLGSPIDEPYVHISIPNGYSYGMDFNTLIGIITDRYKCKK